ncbi:hypothetical protein GT347_20135 [Xylophilus rhododendri]|uniref:Uncharacterized protein n=1 Tax=Xylophilus rhododendri TaxID=2697032 RepID=A0A857J7Z0_9BURK|nr:hypothetical protein [Xylophilus rhododendri]QHJ00085.1 hypothetical protein GT347_20135 [Xylophilus rhododendri]
MQTTPSPASHPAHIQRRPAIAVRSTAESLAREYAQTTAELAMFSDDPRCADLLAALSAEACGMRAQAAAMGVLLS